MTGEQPLEDKIGFVDTALAGEVEGASIFAKVLNTIFWIDAGFGRLRVVGTSRHVTQ